MDINQCSSSLSSVSEGDVLTKPASKPEWKMKEELIVKGAPPPPPPPPPPPIANLIKFGRIARKNTCDVSLTQKEYVPLKWSTLKSQHGRDATNGGTVFAIPQHSQDKITDSIDWKGLEGFKLSKKSACKPKKLEKIKSFSSLSVEAQGINRVDAIVECAHRSIPIQKCITLSILAKKHRLVECKLEDSFLKYKDFHVHYLEKILPSPAHESYVMFLSGIIKLGDISCHYPMKERSSPKNLFELMDLLTKEVTDLSSACGFSEILRRIAKDDLIHFLWVLSFLPNCVEKITMASTIIDIRHQFEFLNETIVNNFTNLKDHSERDPLEFLKDMIHIVKIVGNEMNKGYANKQRISNSEAAGISLRILPELFRISPVEDIEGNTCLFHIIFNTYLAFKGLEQCEKVYEDIVFDCSKIIQYLSFLNGNSTEIATQIQVKTAEISEYIKQEGDEEYKSSIKNRLQEIEQNAEESYSREILSEQLLITTEAEDKWYHVKNQLIKVENFLGKGNEQISSCIEFAQRCISAMKELSTMNISSEEEKKYSISPQKRRVQSPKKKPGRSLSSKFDDDSENCCPNIEKSKFAKKKSRKQEILEKKAMLKKEMIKTKRRL
ncbi:unnamed protein product [Moneuplotes crassus]|uniref:Uncharacterized protein n=2 Tax=Euplotes crassus TaxID=5936 RepID=A0AAD1YB25_EUPCR|nr:unnamed protein product [Moneuplotes crassus]